MARCSAACPRFLIDWTRRALAGGRDCRRRLSESFGPIPLVALGRWVGPDFGRATMQTVYGVLGSELWKTAQKLHPPPSAAAPPSKPWNIFMDNFCGLRLLTFSSASHPSAVCVPAGTLDRPRLVSRKKKMRFR